MFTNSSHARPRRAPLTVTSSSLARSLEDYDRTEGTWYDGRVESITRRASRTRDLIRQSRTLLSHVDEENMVGDSRLQSRISELQKSLKTLKDVEAEFIDATYQEEVQGLPAYTVMAANTRSRALGEHRHGSWKLADTKETNSSYWESFSEVEPKIFLSQLSSDVQKDAGEVRARAADYVGEKTAGVTNDPFRNQLIEAFIDEVERLRRRAQRRQSTRANNRTAQSRGVDLNSLADSTLFL